jgi:hypothetical protein
VAANAKSIFPVSQISAETVEGLVQALNQSLMSAYAPFSVSAQGTKIIFALGSSGHKNVDFVFGELVPLRPIQKVDGETTVVGEYMLSRLRVEEALDLFGYQNVGAIRVEARFDGGQPVRSEPIVLPEVEVSLQSTQTSIVEGGNGVFTVELSEVVTAEEGLKLIWRVEPPSYGGIGASVADFDTAEGLVTIVKGATTATITLNAKLDGIAELSPESFRLVVGHNEPTDPADINSASKQKFVKDAEITGSIAADTPTSTQTAYVDPDTLLTSTTNSNVSGMIV